MSEHSVDVVIRARDEASAKIGLFADNLTAMQAKIANSIGGSTFDNAGVSKIKAQFEQIENWRQQISDKRGEQAVGQHPDFLNALLPPDFSDGIRQRMEKANNELLAGDAKIKATIGSIVGKGTVVGLAAFAIAKVLDSITDAHKRLRESDRTTADYINVWAESIPVFGRVAKSVREMAAELSGANEAAEKIEKIKTAIKALSDIRSGMKKDYSSLADTPATHSKLIAETENAARLDKINASEKELTAAKERLLKILNFIEHVPFMGAKIEELKSKINSVGSEIPLARTESMDLYDKTISEIDAKPVRDITAALEEQVNTWGMSAGEIAVYKAELAGADAAQLQYIKNLNTQLQLREDNKRRETEAAAEEKRLAADKKRNAEREEQDNERAAERVKEMIQTKDQAFAKEEANLEKLRNLGLITNEELYTARNKIAKDIFGDLPQRKKGSTESGFLPPLAPEESRFLTRQRDYTRIDPAVEAAKTLKESKALQQKHLKVAEDANKMLNRINPAVFMYGKL